MQSRRRRVVPSASRWSSLAVISVTLAASFPAEVFAQTTQPLTLVVERKERMQGGDGIFFEQDSRVVYVLCSQLTLDHACRSVSMKGRPIETMSDFLALPVGDGLGFVASQVSGSAAGNDGNGTVRWQDAKRLTPKEGNDLDGIGMERTAQGAVIRAYWGPNILHFAPNGGEWGGRCFGTGEVAEKAGEFVVTEAQLKKWPKVRLTRSDRCTADVEPPVSSSMDLTLTMDPAEEAPEVELRVEVPKDYEAWLPVPGKDEKSPGSKLTLVASLVGKDGKSPKKPPRKVVFELTSSAEPGLTINFPTSKPGKDADLRFPRELNRGLNLDEAGTRAAATEGDLKRVEVTLAAFDGGAYGSVRVWAELADGKRVEGTFGARGGQLLVPFREDAKQRIGAAFLKEYDLKGRDESWDAEKEPKLDGGDGDGLSLYEEYRGVIARGRHARLNPKKKELVIENQVGAAIEPGLAFFAAKTELELVVLDEGELAESHVANVNGAASPKQHQHGVRFTPATPERLAKAGGADTFGLTLPMPEGSIRSPRHVKEILIDSATAQLVTRMAGAGEGTRLPGPDGGASELTIGEVRSMLRTNVAHELAHALGALHHGSGDHRVRADGVRGRVFTAEGKPLDRESLSGYFGVPGGIGSGDEGCIMVYRNPFDWAVDQRGSSSEYRYYQVKPLGPPTHFCTGTRATGRNKGEKLKNGEFFKWFGDVTKALRGNCLGRMHVRDSDELPLQPVY